MKKRIIRNAIRRAVCGAAFPDFKDSLPGWVP